jgi:hypothetical protein
LSTCNPGIESGNLPSLGLPALRWAAILDGRQGKNNITLLIPKKTKKKYERKKTRKREK